MVVVLLIFLNCYLSTLRLVHYALLLTPACWKSNNTNARLMAFAPSLALDPTFGTHSHKTLDTVQPCHLLKPNWKLSSSHNISIITNISTQFLLQSVCVCVFVVHFVRFIFNFYNTWCNQVYCIHVRGHDPLIFSFLSFSFLIGWGFYGPNYLRC